MMESGAKCSLNQSCPHQKILKNLLCKCITELYEQEVWYVKKQMLIILEK